MHNSTPSYTHRTVASCSNPASRVMCVGRSMCGVRVSMFAQKQQPHQKYICNSHNTPHHTTQHVVVSQIITQTLYRQLVVTNAFTSCSIASAWSQLQPSANNANTRTPQSPHGASSEYHCAPVAGNCRIAWCLKKCQGRGLYSHVRCMLTA